MSREPVLGSEMEYQATRWWRGDGDRGSREQRKVQSLSSINTAISLDHVENVQISEWHYALG